MSDQSLDTQRSSPLGWLAQLTGRVARRGSEAVGGLPVRDWVSINTQPTRVMGFDQSLVWV
ncbi:MAG TPA: hypothetical protein VFH49_00360, partial [Aquabacterium sp.]|nr:hypothetical protein [Aquabacterium sp.]